MAAVIGVPTTIDLGNFATGEVPDQLIYGFNDYLDQPIDLDGAAVAFNILDCATGMQAAGAGTVDVFDGPNGQIRYTWVAADFDTPGMFRAQFVATKGGNTYKSDVIRFYVYPAVDYVAP